MVAGTHPHDIDLFDYVEGDLADARKHEVDAHLAACPVCSEQVRRVQAGKEALRGSQFLHLPARRIEGVFMNLPTQPREPGRRRALSPKQLIAVLTPVVAVVAVIAVLANSGTGTKGDEQSAAAGGGAAQAEATATLKAADAAAVDSVAGPPADVAQSLRDKGLRATVEGQRVIVSGASKRQVREALADREPGDVLVFVGPG
ncbi:MAG: zf-HC2 domain-containing protein [Gaiellaceae bacterium]